MAIDTTRLRNVIDRLAMSSALDRFIDPVQSVAQKILSGRLRDFLNGVWLGHPLHPALVQVPVGAWISASALDALPRTRHSATALVGIGSAAALPAALAGWADWSTLAPEQRRVGSIHALSNLVAVGFQTASLIARLSNHRSRGRALSMAGLGVASAGAYLGADMAYRRAVGVNHSAPLMRRIPQGWHRVCSFDDLLETAPTVGEVSGVSVLIARDGEQVTAMLEKCAHQAGPLGNGDVTQIDGYYCVVCPWHGSTYRLKDGAVLRGPAATDQPRLRARVTNGYVEVAAP